ncbi:beta-propeller domain-containing protein [Virgibacillus siamensis]|uniref:beta-propeller domain-containing protein n=1 Tax=Virgibacillus siamensis TaxID=480071 RepID=UPI0009878E8F|nr:beta-propeller domain-containing protein [Virgibacillus siamensis]
MNRKIVLYCLAGLLVIGAVVFFLLPKTIGVTIPAKSSYAPTFKDWSIHFSETMNPNTFTRNTVTVLNQNNEKVDVTFKWNKDHTILTLKAPEYGYQIDHTYMITVSGAVETANGNALNDSFSYSFTAVAELPTIKDKEQLVTLLQERMKNQKKWLGRLEHGITMERSQSDQAKNTAEKGAPSSTTNVQVKGVDEGDIIKTDGDYIYFSRGTDVIIAKAAKKSSKILGKIAMQNFHPTELYLHDDLLIMIGSSSKLSHKPSAPSTEVKRAVIPQDRTTTLIYDVADPKHPKKIRELTMDGSLISSRKTDGYLYLIASQHPPIRLMNKKSPNSRELRPQIKDTAVSNKNHPLSFDRMHFFPESQDESFLLLGSINLKNPGKKADITAYLGTSSEVYMSRDSLYLAANRFRKDFSQDKKRSELAIARPPVDTEISKFNIEDGNISYHASTVVEGRLINQFAMDERDGVFRVATTKGSAWNDDTPSTNNLYTFDKQMNPLGELTGLAKDERIYSVRFMDEVAYMVTFKKTDPLFVIDLKNPKKPTVLGKLKLPGFSNYLHPLDDDHLIGFGQNTKLVQSENGLEPRVQIDGLKISVFDVSNPAKPKEEYSKIIGEGHSYTEVNYDHHALYKHPENPIFGFPATIYDSKTIHKGDASYQNDSLAFSGLFLYRITPDNGIQLKDSITQQKKSDYNRYKKWNHEIKRMVSAGDMIYIFSPSTMRVYNISEENIIQTIQLPASNLK